MNLCAQKAGRYSERSGARPEELSEKPSFYKTHEVVMLPSGRGPWQRPYAALVVLPV